METFCRFRPLSFSWAAVHPRPVGIVQFIGGAFFGSFPTISYRYFLSRFYAAGYTVVALPYKFSTRHWPVAVALFKEQLHLREKLAAQARSLGYDEAIYSDRNAYAWVGHSLGCKYIALLELLSAGDWPAVVAGCAERGEIERIEEAVTGLLGGTRPSIRDQPSLLIAPDMSDTEAAVPLPVLARLVEKLGFRVQPTRAQTCCFTERSRLFNLTALVSFQGDTIAGTDSDPDLTRRGRTDVPWLKQVLATRPVPLLYAELPGKHLSPVGVRWGDLLVDGNPLDKFAEPLVRRQLERVCLEFLEALFQRNSLRRTLAGMRLDEGVPLSLPPDPTPSRPVPQP